MYLVARMGDRGDSFRYQVFAFEPLIESLDNCLTNQLNR